MEAPRHTVPHSRYTNTCKIALSAITCFLTLLGGQASAQDLFDGIPDPSMANYAALWETITGYPYRADASSLILGTEVSPGLHELIAFQVAEIPDETISEVVGTVQVLQSYTYTWLLPYEQSYTVDDGSNVFDATATLSSRSASALIQTNAGLIYPVVTILGDIDLVITGGTGESVVIGETASITTFTPLGFPVDLPTADAIADRIALFAVYEGDPIDLNQPPAPDPGGDIIIITMGDMLCQARCQNAYDSDQRICANNLDAALRNCNIGLIAGIGAGCASGVGLCGFFPWTAPMCCIAGGIAGGGSVYFTCRSISQNNYSNCMRNAFEGFALCMLNDCGIVIVDE